MKIKKIDIVHLTLQGFVLSSLLWFTKLPWDTQEGLGFLLGALTITLSMPISYLSYYVFKNTYGGGFIELMVSIMLHILIVYLIVRIGFPNPFKFIAERKIRKIQKEIESKEI